MNDCPASSGAAPASAVSGRVHPVPALLLATVLAGIFCRLRLYGARASFWADEAFVVLNIIDHSFLRLLHHLDHGQAAPPMFLWIERLMLLKFGASEYALRLLPLVCGMSSLILFAVLAARLFSPAVAACATALFAFSDKLIAYSAETKQYSGDAMMSVLLLLFATWPNRSPLRRLAHCSILATIAIWFSHTSAIVFGAVSLVLLIECRRAGPRTLLAAIGWNAVVAASFAAMYLLSIRHQNTPWMHFVWRDDFPDFARPATIPRWLIRESYDLLSGPYPMVGPLLVLAALLGAIALWRNRKVTLLLLLIGPIVLTICAAFMQKYPFNSSRLTLFLLPQVFLLCAAGFEAARRALPERLSFAWLVLPLPIVAVGAGEAGMRLISPRFRSHIRPAVEFVRTHRSAGEAIYLTGQPGNIDPDPTEGRHLELLCYWRDPDPPLHTLNPPSWHDVPERRFWIVFPFQRGKTTDWQRQMLKEISDVAVEKERFVEPRGGAAYLFELRRK